jgi:hypothetical protein
MIDNTTVETTSSFSYGYWKYIFKIEKENQTFLDFHFEKFYSTSFIRQLVRKIGFTSCIKTY